MRYAICVKYKMKNPFIIAGYESPSYFCNRKRETERILSAIDNNRNLTLFSQRRLGKTGLLRHVLYKLRKERKLNLIYIDIYPTKNIYEFVNELAKGVFFSFGNKKREFIEKVGELFKSLTPIITYDPLSGSPSLSFNFNSSKEAFNSIEQIFSVLDKSKKKNVIVIDEFQQIANYPEKETEALLRTHIQKLNNSVFIYSGSQKHLLLSMFGEPNRPFYQSSELMQLKKINFDEYKRFIIKMLSIKFAKIEEEAVDFILTWTKRHTYFVQYLCNRLFASEVKVININNTKYQCRAILDELEPVFLNYRNMLSEFQWELLKGIALEDGVKKITSKDFIQKYKLGSTSSVQRGIKSLLSKELVSFDDNKQYFLQDIFFANWFLTKYNNQ